MPGFACPSSGVLAVVADGRRHLHRAAALLHPLAGGDAVARFRGHA
jgi:hypothetical protein